MPCLNEARTVGVCVAKAVRALRELGASGEVIVADNGSTDGSRDLAERAGARFVPLQSVFDDLSRRTAPAYWAADGVHPTAAGHAVIAERWRRAAGL